MRVHLIKKQSIQDFVIKNARSKTSFEGWLSVINGIEWNKPQDIISTFNSADILGKDSDRVVFNIGGNNYRMICKYFFGIKRVHLFVKWIGTHSEYTKLCSENQQFKVNVY